MSEFYTIAYPVARKSYRCEEARCEIKAGERYCRHSGKQEGYMFDVKVCLNCQGMRSAAWEAFGHQWWDSGPTFGELRSEITEETGQDAEAWYAGYLAEQAAQADLRAILGAAVASYQTGNPHPRADND